jgi:hypothetical protein
MSVMGRAISFYPTLILSLTAATIFWLAHRPSPVQPAVLILILYLLPPITLRIHEIFFPLREGASKLSDPKYSHWWGAHQIQLIYIALPQLEALLRLVPGLYSAWLRLWGSRVGRSVYWTPNIEITDRSRLEIGDRVVFGHKCKLLGHAIKPKGDEVILYLRRIKIGNNAFIGAGSRIGPGAVIGDGAYLPVLTDVYINQAIES